jgi:glutamate dehydrogenase (NAD(P)+)
MTVYSGPVFDMAASQFGVIADYLSIPNDERARLLLPKRAVVVSCPIHRDDGSTAVFEGYRVQHHLTLGPTKGHSFCRKRRSRRSCGPCDLDELEVRAGRSSIRRAKGGIGVDPSSLSAHELNRCRAATCRR